MPVSDGHARLRARARSTSVRPMKARDAVARGGDRGAELREDRRVERAARDAAPRRSATSSESTTSPSSMKPSTSVRKSSRSAPTPTAIAAAASSAFTFSGPGRERRDHRDPAGVEDAHEHRQVGERSGRRRGRAPASASRAQADLVAEERHRALAERGPERLVDGRERARARSRSPPAVVTRRPPTNSTGMPGALHLGADLRAGAVDDAHLVARARARARASADCAATAPPTLTTSRLMSGSPR